jgi:hypothetical protein
MTEQHIIIDSEQTLEAMLEPVGRDLLHYPCNNPPDAGKHCSKFKPTVAAPTNISRLPQNYDVNRYGLIAMPAAGKSALAHA